LHLYSQDKDFSKVAARNTSYETKIRVGQQLYFQYLSEKNLDSLNFKKCFETIAPHFIDEKGPHCLWKPSIDGLVTIEFRHTSPKHNTLYLYDYNNKDRKIRLDIINGIFRGCIYVSKGKCIDLRWKKSKHGSPSNNEENKLTLFYLSDCLTTDTEIGWCHGFRSL